MRFRLNKAHWVNPVTALYREARLAQDIRRSLSLMMLGNLFGNMFGVICGGGTNTMIGLANYLGAGDLAFGVINGIPQAAMLMQIPFSMLVSRTQKRKQYILTYGLISRAMWILFGFIPFVIPTDPHWLPLFTLIFLLGISSCATASINVCWMPWFAELAPIRIRGRWMSIRDSVCAVGSVLFGLLVAYLLDELPGLSKYAILFTMGGILGVMDTVMFAFAKEVNTTPPVRMKFSSVTKDVFSNKPFLRFMLFWTAWCFCANMSGPYLNRYALNEMGLNYMQVTIFANIASGVITMLVISRWGRLMDNFGAKPIMMVSGCVAAVTPLFFVLSVPGSIWPLFLHNFIGAAFWSACNLAATNMQFIYSPEDKRSSYIAFFACITSLVGTALGTVTGGAVLDAFESLGWFAGGGFIDRYKVMFMIAVTLRILSVLLLVPRMDNDREGTNRDVLRALLPKIRI